MSHPTWITLSTSWDLGNVRAVFAFLINVLLAIGLWVVSYASWKYGALQAARKSRVHLLSLLSMSGLGDAVDSLSVISFSMGARKLLCVLGQASAVVALSVAVVLSGPIARYSTRRGVEVQLQDVGGWLATTNHSSMGGALVRWNETIERLKSAQFPEDQLLDFLPNNLVDWLYKAEEWNSSWTVSCIWKPRSPISLEATGNYTGHFFDEVPGMRAVFPEASRKGYAGNVQWRGAYENNDIIKDILAFVIVETDPSTSLDETTGLYFNHEALHLILGAFHMHNVPQTSDSDGNFGTGPIESASYTVANCSISRAENRTHDDLDVSVESHIAFPWTVNTLSTISAFAEFHQAGIVEQSFNGEEIYLPSGQGLFRFYQGYMISKDTQYKQSVARSISVEVPSVELSTIALALILLYVFGTIVIFLWATLVMRLPKGMWVPRTKVEWMLQGVREVGGREIDAGLWEVGWDGLRRGLRSAVLGRGVGVMGGTSMNIQLGQDLERPSVVEVHQGKR